MIPSLENNKRRLIIWIVVFQALDVLITAIAVYGVGLAEANPLINIMPLWALMIIKVVLIAIVLIILWKTIRYLWVYKLILVVSIFIVTWNCLVMVFELLN